MSRSRAFIEASSNPQQPDRLLRVSELAAAWCVPVGIVYGFIRKGVLDVERLPSSTIRVKASAAVRCGPPAKIT